MEKTPVGDLNIIVNGPYLLSGDRELLFPEDEVVNTVSEQTNMFDLLVALGAFESKSQARKQWKKTGIEIPAGWSSFRVGKMKRELCIWNPDEREFPTKSE
jgi:hypothetical protein